MGFANFYLYRCNMEAKLTEKIDIRVFTRLAELDSKLGTTVSEQLLYVLTQTTRWDIIKV